MNKTLKYKRAIVKEIGVFVKNSEFDRKFREMILYSLGWLDEDMRAIPVTEIKSKMFRPVLMLEVYGLFAKERNRALPLAAAIEMLHNFTLVHDDIEDNDRYRRGRKTVWNMFGIPQAINTGDAMLLISNLLALRLESKGFSAKMVLGANKIMNQAYLSIAHGQFYDIDFETRRMPSSGEYLKMSGLKTATLVGAACEAGAFLGGRDSRVRKYCRDFGCNLGLAFQIKNDIEGIWGRKGTAGKQGGDLKKRKKTLPVILFFNGLNRRDQVGFNRTYKQGLSGRDIRGIAQAMERKGIKEKTEKQMKPFIAKAARALKLIPLASDRKTILLEYLEKLLNV